MQPVFFVIWSAHYNCLSQSGVINLPAQLGIGVVDRVQSIGSFLIGGCLLLLLFCLLHLHSQASLLFPKVQRLLTTEREARRTVSQYQSSCLDSCLKANTTTKKGKWSTHPFSPQSMHTPKKKKKKKKKKESSQQSKSQKTKQKRDREKKLRKEDRE